ncbi:MAG: hypothetical protein LBW77_02575 [Verrucomicrobiota bacterium]|nr:hypothetical protein [Verrucomicrobiota bacterium]
MKTPVSAMRVKKHRRSFACCCGKKRRLLAVPGRDTLLFNDLLGTTLGSSHGDTFQGGAGSAFGEGGSDGLFFTGKPQVAGLGHAFLMRNYRADHGKWLTADPLGYPDGWNNLAYVNNGVTSAIDWMGAATFDFFLPDDIWPPHGDIYNPGPPITLPDLIEMKDIIPATSVSKVLARLGGKSLGKLIGQIQKKIDKDQPLDEKANWLVNKLIEGYLIDMADAEIKASYAAFMASGENRVTAAMVAEKLNTQGISYSSFSWAVEYKGAAITLPTNAALFFSKRLALSAMEGKWVVHVTYE